MSKITKKQKKLQELLADFTQPASGREALTKLQEISKEVAKFNETVECHMRLGIEVKHADQQVRGAIVLPNGTGKNVRVLAICKGDNERLYTPALNWWNATRTSPSLSMQKPCRMPLRKYLSSRLRSSSILKIWK